MLPDKGSEIIKPAVKERVDFMTMTLSIEKQRFAVVGLLLSWCVVLVLFRLYLSGDMLPGGLLWNLFLAVVPLFWSVAFQKASAHRQPIWQVVFFGLWVLFLPNAPYILTDLIHLSSRRNVPEWYMLAVLLSCAGTGTLLGYLSLINVQTAIEKLFNKTLGWLVAIGALMLCGFGIYIGRFLRWNSWDVFTNPIHLAKNVVRQFLDESLHSHPISVTLIYGVGLIIGYLALRGIATTLCVRQPDVR